MFLDSLSASLLQLCHAENLSYERASERCQCCAKHFSNIVNRRTSPTLTVFEHICSGFGKAPNQLLGVAVSGTDELSYRLPMPVVEVRVHVCDGIRRVSPICPRCRRTFWRISQAYCDHCGQCLSWEDFQQTAVTLSP